MALCDLCKSECRSIEMAQLLDFYQVPGVVDLCPACRKWADELKSDMLRGIAPRMRAAIAERADLPPQVARRPWWRRMFERREQT